MITRIQKLRAELENQKLDAVFVSSLPNIIYLTGFRGFSPHEREAFVLIMKQKQFLFTYDMFMDTVKKHIKGFTFLQITKDTPLSLLLQQIIVAEKSQQIGFEAFDLKVNEFERITTNIAKKFLINTTVVSQLRMYKDPEEIRNIKAACAISEKSFNVALTKVQTGLTELQLANEIEYAMRTQNATIAFDTISAFGKNTAFPHHSPTQQKIQTHDAILLDFGAKVNGYCADVSRTLFFGKPSTVAKKVYQTVFDAYQEVLEYIEGQLEREKDVVVGDIDRVAREYITSHGYPAFPHALGHGVGIEVHELPHISPHFTDKLKNGMAFAIEPAIYLVDEVGVRIEDIFTIQKNKLVQLSHSPTQTIEV